LKGGISHGGGQKFGRKSKEERPLSSRLTMGNRGGDRVAVLTRKMR
jgi:hypothetical protein